MEDKAIYELMDRFARSGLGAIEVEREGSRVRIERDCLPALRHDAVSYNEGRREGGTEGECRRDYGPAKGGPGSAPGPQPSAGGSEACDEVAITSPIIGTFYRSPGPDSPVFVTEGCSVKKGDSLCIIEAMKVMNRLEAEFNCEILSIEAKNGDLVEYGQELFRVRPL